MAAANSSKTASRPSNGTPARPDQYGPENTLLIRELTFITRSPAKHNYPMSPPTTGRAVRFTVPHAKITGVVK
jgi:hypothetical protein